MRIHGVVACVDYADLLAHGLRAWRDGLDSLVVVTAPRDRETLDLCEAEGVLSLATSNYWRDGAAFNKAAALDLGLELLSPTDWLLVFDADVEPPPGWRATVEAALPQPGSLYGAVRRDETGARIEDFELAGFFQLWHSADHAWTASPTLGSWHNASGYDSEHMLRWPLERRALLPLSLTHRGQRGVNWCGRGNAKALAAMHQRRRMGGGFQHERLDRGR